MEQSAGPGRAAGDRQSEFLAALERYRAWRARDGGEPGAIECLLDRAPVAAEDAARHRRREELIERAVHEDGVERRVAEEVYDLARDEGIEPAFAFELVRCGVAVTGPEGEEPDAPTTLRGYPTGLYGLPTDDARRERLLRSTFRRLRGLLETKGSPEEALIAFAHEPDVGEYEY